MSGMRARESSPGGVRGAGGRLGVRATRVLVLLARLAGGRRGGHGAGGFGQDMLDSLLRHTVIGAPESSAGVLVRTCQETCTLSVRALKRPGQGHWPKPEECHFLNTKEKNNIQRKPSKNDAFFERHFAQRSNKHPISKTSCRLRASTQGEARPRLP